MMSAKILVCVSEHQATCGYFSRGHLHGCEVFDHDDEGYAGFGKYLKLHRRIPIYLMTDVVKEDYRYEFLPHAMGRDRREMLERKLKQLYRATPYSAAWLQGREQTKRRDDRYLFAAMTSPELLGDWLKVIEHLHAPLGGIYPLPLVTQLAVEKLALQPGHLLLVSRHSAGLRQSFFGEERLRISRLTPFESGGRPTSVESYAEEIANTRYYLDSLRIAPLDEPLTVAILNLDGSLSGLESLLSGPPNVHCRLLTVGDVAHLIGANPGLLQRYPDALHLQLLGLRAPAANLAPRALVAGHKRYQARRWVHALSAHAATGAALWCGVNFLIQLDYQKQAESIALERRNVHSLYEQVTKQFPASPVGTEELRKTVEMAEALSADAASPITLFSALGRALGASPNVFPTKLTWKAGGKERPSTGNRAASQSGILEAEIRPFKGDYREALSTINQFEEKLKAEPAITSVKVLQLPLSINPNTALSGSTQEIRESATGASFKLELKLREGA
jgi:hypothetical protein